MRDGSATRKRLERCALALFVRKGISATTIKDIAQKADIAEGTLYRHYESKEELAQSLFSKAYTRISLELKNFAEKFPTISQQIEAMVRYFCEQYDQDPILFNYLLLVQHTQIKILTDKDLNAHGIIVSLFNEAISKKEIARARKDADFYAAILMGIVLQAALSRVYGRITRPMTEDADDLVKAILGALQL